jgi:uncharacterized protein with NRDE domain
MCTVVFIPEDDKLIFASLRDENPFRPIAILPEIVKDNETTILAPQDALAGGTWLGINDSNNILILLNGGFEKHIRSNTYRKSRGLIVTELLSSNIPVIDWQIMEMKEIEPYTLVVWSEDMLFQLVWDGIKKHRIKLDSTKPHIFSSSTLYPTEAKTNRQELFHQWMGSKPKVTKLSLLNFFESSLDSINGFIINRKDEIKTLSYSFIELIEQTQAQFDYYDLQNNSHNTQYIKMKKSEKDCTIPN